MNSTILDKSSSWNLPTRLSSPDVLTRGEKSCYLSKTGLVDWVGQDPWLKPSPRKSVWVPSRFPLPGWSEPGTTPCRRQAERGSHSLKNLDLCETKKPLAVEGHRARCLGKMTHKEMDEATAMALSSPWSYNWCFLLLVIGLLFITFTIAISSVTARTNGLEIVWDNVSTIYCPRDWAGLLG